MQKSKTEIKNLPIEIIERKIYLIRGHKVMVDRDLAYLYQVTTGNLNLAVRRNHKRFPEDFMFQLTKEEMNSLLLQSARAKKGRGGRQTSPYVFTEHGVSMLSSVLNSDRAVQMNILIIRAFVKIREMLSTHKDIVAEIEKMKIEHKKHDEQILAIMNVINRLLEPPKKKDIKMGFQPRN